MKANNITIENALHLAFTPEYVDAFGLAEIADVWNSNHDTRDLDLNLNAYAEKCTYKMEQDGVTLEFDAWDRLTAEIERFAGVWVLLYCNEVSWNNRPEWLTNSVRNAINNPDNTTPSTSDTMNTETKTVEFSELSHAGQCLDIYLHNTAEIYQRYTVEAVKLVVNAFTNQGPVKLDDATAWDNLTFWISWQPVTKKAVTAAVKLVKKHDHMTPTAKDIEQVTRNYTAYIVENAKYEVENA
ncbi:MAG: hypothetical protein HDR82_09935 [Bacteroides sp.]|nr:hypothetical protein [Bacteroides sp.]